MTPASRRSPRLQQTLLLTIGLVLGWSFAGARAPALHAQGGDRWDESILATGPAFIKYNEGSKIQVAQDAIYFLDYRAGKLFGTLPSMKQLGAESKIISGFSERDLVADFKLDVDTGVRPHFLMTTGAMSSGVGNTYGDGWAPLFVFETTTRKVGVYKIQQQMLGTSSRMKLDLIELRPFAAQVATAR
ncbi:MAG: hypothetical protein NVSMB9_07950 [Isosphaeraceae bacterium]